MIRDDQSDVIYKTEKAKFNAVVEDIVERHQKGQPVLVGTVSVENSEILSQMLRRRGIPHSVLNAKYHAKEAEIIAQAGRRGGVTVATNMAGRGTDILLGGNPEFLAAAELRNRGLDPDEQPEEYEAALVDAIPRWKKQCDEEAEEVIEAGGLYVLGTERHDSRRIDNQLRGRSGRQGDPGESRFYLSLQDDLMKRFRAGAVEAVMDRLNIPEDVPIESKMVTRQIRERADPDRGAERRDPQGRAQVRRGAQQAAPGDLRRAPPGARRRGPARPGRAHDRRHRAGLRARRHLRRLRRGLGPRPAVDQPQAALPGRRHRRGARGGGRRRAQRDRHRVPRRAA